MPGSRPAGCSTAGLGMFLLARSWGLGFWGRWFAGLVYPFCGFLVVWLLFPVTAVAIWMPWLFLATDRVFRAPGPRSAGVLAIVDGAGRSSADTSRPAPMSCWRAGSTPSGGWIGRRLGDFDRRRVLLAWAAGTGLGIGLAAVQILPLAVYLSRSPVWGDRQRETTAVVDDRRGRDVLDAVCTALPYAYGSQRRGHPNLARALGVHNLNESAGGYAGLATLIWLAPLALRRRVADRLGVSFLIGMAVFGAMGALPAAAGRQPAAGPARPRRHRQPQAHALGRLRLDPAGRDRARPPGPDAPAARAAGSRSGSLGGTVLARRLACGDPALEPAIRARAIAHYRRAAARTPRADPASTGTGRAPGPRGPASSSRATTAWRRPSSLILAGAGCASGGAAACPGRSRPPGVARTDARRARPSSASGSIRRSTGEIHDFEPPVIARLREGLPPRGPGARASARSCRRTC